MAVNGVSDERPQLYSCEWLSSGKGAIDSIFAARFVSEPSFVWFARSGRRRQKPN